MNRLFLTKFWTLTVGKSITVYSYVTLTVAVSNVDQCIQATMKMASGDCKYQSGICPTERVILTWTARNIEICKLKAAETTHVFSQAKEYRVQISTWEFRKLTYISL